MEAGGYLIDKAILHGVNQGRGGKGSIFVFARYVHVKKKSLFKVQSNSGLAAEMVPALGTSAISMDTRTAYTL